MNFENIAVYDYRDSLVQELKSRIEKNPSYSLRAFARDIDLSPGYLSQLVNRQKSLSPRKATAILKKLKWSYEKEKRFINAVQYEHSDIVDDGSDRKDFSKGLHSFDHITLDIFELISRWHFGALLELITLPNSVHTSEWLSNKLDIPISTVDDALMILSRLGFLEKISGGYKRLSPHLNIKDIPSEAIRNFHAESLDRAKSAIEVQTVKERYFSSVIMPFKKDRLPIIGDQIEKFRDTLNNQESNQSGDSVYQLCISFFQVDGGGTALQKESENAASLE